MQNKYFVYPVTPISWFKVAVICHFDVPLFLMSPCSFMLFVELKYITSCVFVKSKEVFQGVIIFYKLGHFLSLFCNLDATLYLYSEP